ncbi:G-D-S-L family lipolytic protein [Sphingobacterium paramultivorum]|uniref:G-D-S-L family lipolytic protein n=1 Tax=Sphingobacterium paramultivorum TaxID=2886510 RepID=A0A7G5DZA9_9SPHI|nr:GDSL-type esterase/lipase family protein [Sphingobacterium paramultivorum]QMV67084.1 G-D-S-L family lipolytic protein [Sphingobacterium paramultivorum]WSO15926.1 GDSL-type esterase/lipase family protein [Sphingobacterium paramultivorum]
MNRKYIPKMLLFFIGSVLLAGILTGFKWMSDQNDEKITIVMFGDSITKGGDWATLLGRSDVKNSGFPGFTTSHLVWLLKENVIDLKPRVCFLEGGINDIGVGIPLERTKSNYRSLIDGLKEHQIVPVVQSILYQQDNPESKVQVDSLNSYLNAYCQSKGVYYLDINGKLSSSKGLNAQYTTDGTHINQEAYGIWASEVKNLLKSIL